MKNLLFLFFILFAFGINAQDFNKAKMDSLFMAIEENGKGMGSISIFEEGKEVYSNSFGYLSIEDSIKADQNTKYRIGSVSKTFTATIIMRLIEEEKLSLYTKIDKFFPEIPNSDKITIEHLLRHRSGIFNFTSSPDYKDWMEKPISKIDLVKKIAYQESIFEADSKAVYSNSNYVLLSLIIEKVTELEYSSALKKYITVPCKLNDTYYGSMINIDEDEAYSYVKTNKWELATETDMSVPLGAGGIVSTPKDLNKFMHCLFHSTTVSEKSLLKMLTIIDGFGLGIFEIPFYDKKAYGHNGSIDGFQSSAAYFDKENVAVAYTSNGVVMPMNDVIIGALSIYFGEKYEIPAFSEAIQLTSEDLEKYLGVYSSVSFPLKITISSKENMLIGQATGQPSFPLEAYEINKFRFDQANLKIEFIPEKDKLILRQNGGEYELSREE